MVGTGGPSRVSRPRIAPWIVSALVVFFAAAPLACGGGEETTEEAITKAEWVTRADRICVRAGKTIGPQTDSVFRKHPPDTDELISWFRNLAPLYRQAILELDAIPVPGGDERQVAAILDAADGTADRIEQGITDPGIRRALLAEGVSPKIFRAFRDYGVTRCARVTNPIAAKAVPGPGRGARPGA